MFATIYLIILIEGFVTISVEMLAIRQLIPFFGSSVIITSIIIGIFLLFLALGYWRGGFIKNNFLIKMSKNFAIALLLIGFGFSYVFIHLFVYFFTITLNLSHLRILVLFLLLVLAPIIFLLGQTVPLTTNLFNQAQTVAGISGRALFLSTIGSFLGAIITTLVLFHYFGIGFSVFFNCLLLLILIFHITLKVDRSLLPILVLAVITGIIYLLNVNFEKLTFVKTNNYANYQVETQGLNRMLRINNSNSSLITVNKKGYEYIEKIKDILFRQLKLTNKDILVIGAGGFTLSYEKTYGNVFDYVDVDSNIKNIAEKYYLSDKIKGRFYGIDGRLFLNKNHKQYDVIISDAYTTSHSIPAALVTREYFYQIKHALKPGGLFLANIIANPYFSDIYSRAIHNTISQVFHYCAVVPLSWDNQPTNIIYVCPNKKTIDKFYSDDLSTVTLDYFKSMDVLETKQ